MFESRFIYMGNAAGVGARFQRVDEDPKQVGDVPVLAPCCLPVTGGTSNAQATNYRYPQNPGLLSVGSTSTECLTETLTPQPPSTSAKTSRSAPPPPAIRRTHASANVKDLRLVKLVNLDQIAVRLTSTFGPKQRFANIVPEQADISGLVIDGHKVEVTVDLAPFQEYPTKRALGLQYASNPRFRKANWERFNADGPKAQRIPQSKGLYIVSVVSSIRIDDKPADVKIERNYRIIWPGIGTIILGEMIIGDYYRRVTMLRCQFGSPVAGDASAGDVQSNGVMMP